MPLINARLYEAQSNNWRTNMLRTISIQQETVGLAFQAALAATYATKSKRKQKAEFNRLKRSLSALRLIDSTFDVQYIGWATDRNGEGHVIVVGEDNGN
jgi:hypothetical protein